MLVRSLCRTQANLEFLRTNYRKSIKLLNSCSRTGTEEALYLNSMGCIHYRLRRFRSASFYFARALSVGSSTLQARTKKGSQMDEYSDWPQHEVLPAPPPPQHLRTPVRRPLRALPRGALLVLPVRRDGTPLRLARHRARGRGRSSTSGLTKCPARRRPPVPSRSAACR